MVEWMARYSDWLGMSPVSVLTTVFGAFCVAFVVIVCWGKLVEDFGPAGGMMAAGIIIGTFWVMNHKLPGFGIHPEGIPHPNGGSKQFGLIYQGFRGAAPWVDMGTAIGVGLWVCGLCEHQEGRKRRWPRERAAARRGAIVAASSAARLSVMIGWTGANLFGYQ